MASIKRVLILSGTMPACMQTPIPYTKMHVQVTKLHLGSVVQHSVLQSCLQGSGCTQLPILMQLPMTLQVST